MLQVAYHVIVLSIICLTSPGAAGRAGLPWPAERRPLTVLWRTEFPAPTAAEQADQAAVWSEDEESAPQVAWLEQEQPAASSWEEQDPPVADSWLGQDPPAADSWLDQDPPAADSWPEKEQRPRPGVDGCSGGALDCLLRHLLRSDLERASQQKQQPPPSRGWRRRDGARQRRPTLDNLLTTRQATASFSQRSGRPVRPSAPPAISVERRSNAASSGCLRRCSSQGGSAARCGALCGVLQPRPKKRKSPSCMRRCMMQGLLHPAQCHSLC